MTNKQQFIKIVDCSINTHIRDLFGDIEDENGESYSEVYEYELNKIYKDIGEFLNTIADKEIFLISLEQLTGALIFRWNFTFGIDNDISKNTFRRIANSILIRIERIEENPNYI